MRTTRAFLLTTVCLGLALAGCGSGGLGDILGGSSPPGRLDDDLRGTVERVDTRDRIIWVEADSSYRSELRDAGDQVALYYDEDTIVEYEGRTFEPDALERGDRIAADVERSGSRLVANQIEVLYDVTQGSGSGSNSSLADVRGLVRYVDTRDRTIELERAQVDRQFESDERDGVVVLHYDADTVVEFEGRRYEPENLERGDEVEVEVRDLGSRLLAEEIVVVADARGR
ncbi:MAG TPA: hypothetical protein VF121_04650 [Thermoanaerobaculia bacterium]|nr:hypothetical protein [Thermoanaerobaculia bacterium]